MITWNNHKKLQVVIDSFIKYSNLYSSNKLATLEMDNSNQYAYELASNEKD